MSKPDERATAVATSTSRRRGLLLAATALVAVTALATGILTDGGTDEGTDEGTGSTSTPTEAELRELRVPLGISPGFSILTDSTDDLRRDLDAIQELGLTRLRIDLSWAALQPGPDRFDWTAADRVLDEAAARDIDVLAVLGFLPDWARRTDPAGVTLPVDPVQFAEFASLAATRYATQVEAWEIWNEPNTQRFWGAPPDPAAYAAVVSAAAPEIRRADPDAPVVIGAIAPADDTTTEISPATFLSGIYEDVALTDFDAVSVHPYTYPETATGTQPFNTFFRLDELHDIMTQRGDGATPVWLTEYGAPTGTSGVAVTEQRQSELISIAICEARRRSYIGPMYLYGLRDPVSDATDPEANFGILRNDGSPKAAYDTLDDGIDCS